MSKILLSYILSCIFLSDGINFPWCKIYNLEYDETINDRDTQVVCQVDVWYIEGNDGEYRHKKRKVNQFVPAISIKMAGVAPSCVLFSIMVSRPR